MVAQSAGEQAASIRSVDGRVEDPWEIATRVQ